MPTLLRKLKVLAARTGAGRLDAWVTQELDGYPDDEGLPSYRGPFPATVLGHFLGIAGAEAQNIAIPPSTFPETMRETHLFKIHLPHSVAELEDMATQETVGYAWPADVVRYYNYGLSKGLIQRVLRDDMYLAAAARPIPRQVIVGALDTVRTRVLDLALELEQVAPDAGQPDALPEAKGQAAQVIKMYNLYGTSNVAIDSSDFRQTIRVLRGDEASLMQALRDIGVEPGQLDDLQKALAEDRTEAGGQNPSRPGSRVAAWIASASTQVGSGAAAGLITEAVKAFFGG